MQAFVAAFFGNQDDLKNCLKIEADTEIKDMLGVSQVSASKRFC